MEKINLFLPKLQGVKRTGHGKFIAKCPAHADKSPSLSLREMPDGNISLNCFSGCEFGSILAALGLEAKDCFADSERSTRKYRIKHRSHEIESEVEMLQRRYGISLKTARAFVKVHLQRLAAGTFDGWGLEDDLRYLRRQEAEAGSAFGPQLAPSRQEVALCP